MNVIYPEQVGAKPLETENAESAYVPPVVNFAQNEEWEHQGTLSQLS